MKTLRTRIFIAISSVIAIGILPMGAAAQDLSSVDIPYVRHVLNNGLTLLVHEDHSAPQVFVSVYYRVGSRDEEPGKTGFAHLFEHLMFNGTENHPEAFNGSIQDVGGGTNGDTWFDRTRYYQNVPNTALDLVLWLESDRMGHLLGAIDEEKLEREVGVVQNEKRRGDNRPYAMSQYNMLEGLFPEGHPYRWQTIGSMADLEAATLDDVRAWFGQYYGAANAILIVAGDVDPNAVVESVDRHFGDIPPGPVVSRLDDWVPVRVHNTTEVMQDRVASPAIMRSWVAPGRDRDEYQYLALASQILGGDESSRLHKALVEDAGLASSVRLLPRGHDLASMPILRVMLLPDSDQQVVESIIGREMALFFEGGPTEDELALAKTSHAANRIRQLDSVRDRAALLIESEFYLDAPDGYKDQFRILESASRNDVRNAAETWLGDGYHQITVEPFGDLVVADRRIDRSVVPHVTEFPDAIAPEIEDRVLSNGIRLRYVKRQGVPTVTLAAQFSGGFSLDENGQAGISNLTLQMLDRGTDHLDAREIQEQLKRSGSSLTTEIGNDSSVLRLSTLSSKLEDAAKLFADVIQNPTLANRELLLLKNAQVAAIENSKSAPDQLVRRYLKWVAYGDSHAYGTRPAGRNEVESLRSDDLLAFHSRVYRPDNLVLYAVGSIEIENLIEVLEKTFGDWKVGGPMFEQELSEQQPSVTKPKVILFDAPSAPQSNILAFKVIPPPYGKHHDAFFLANWIYGGSFASRINANLRQEKGWSYGVNSAVNDAIGPRIWSIVAQVQTDKTAPSIVELLSELNAIGGDRPISTEEFTDVQKVAVRSLAGRLSNSGEILEYVMNMTANGRPDDFIETRKDVLEGLTMNDLQTAFDETIEADSLTWLIAGDLSVIEQQIRDLDLGDVEVWSADGEKVR